MAGAYVAYYLALGTTVLTSVALAGLLWFRAGQRTALKPLVWFCLGIALWVAGHLLIALGTELQARVGQALVNGSLVVAAFFTHFALALTGCGRPGAILAIYVGTAIVTGVAVVGRVGTIEPWLEFSRFYRLDPAAWALAWCTLGLSLAGHLVLVRAIRTGARPPLRRQLIAVFVASAGGFVAASGFLLGSLGVAIFPYPVLALPGYTLILVYGILRYELMEVNVWARRSLTSALLATGMLITVSAFVTFSASLGWAQFARLPLWQLWVFSGLVVLVASALHRPMLALATRLIYPGSRMDARLLDAWREALEKAQTWDDLRATAAALVSLHLEQPVDIVIDAHSNHSATTPLGIRCRRGPASWSSELVGWEAATPGLRRTGEVFGALLATAAARLEQAMLIAEREKNVVEEAQLADLGRLSASVAHELRNPLNIIGMASAQCSPTVKRDILDQLGRAERLVKDLLTYAGRLSIEKTRVNLDEQVAYVVSHYARANPPVSVEVPKGTAVCLDAQRLHQILFNLIDNARHALGDRPDGRVTIAADHQDGWVTISVCDNGPGVPDVIKHEVFRPFVSGRPGGSGLGLAIARRLVEAHGGTIRFRSDPAWPCCIELRFPVGDCV
ncbi:MAG: ATP-binding protein [Nitrospirota bacterium]